MKKNYKPLNYGFSCNKTKPSKNEIIKTLLSLARLACEAGDEKRLKAKQLNNEENFIKEKLEQKEITEKFLSDFQKALRKENF